MTEGPERADSPKPEATPQHAVERSDGRSSGVLVQASFSGPLPPPGMLASYERILPGSAHRMFLQVESEQKHRQRIESRGQVFAFVLSSLALVGGTVLLAMDKNLAGFAVYLSALVPLVVAFITGRAEKQADALGDEDKARLDT